MNGKQAAATPICIGILAHVDAGKTTLTERLLQHAGAIQAAGSVDQGTAQTDYLAVERARGISVRAASARLDWRGRTINLIDTPGHRDFEGEVRRSLNILDAAILCLSAVEGIEAQSEEHWRQLAARGLPVLLFVNKTDRTGADAAAVLDAMHRLAGRPLLPLARPDAWLAELAENDGELADAWLAGERVPPERLERALADQFLAGAVLPWLAGSALQDRGIAALLDAVTRLVEPRLEPQSGESRAYVYKAEQDRRLGRLAHVRLLAGELENRQPLWNPRTGESGKIVQIRQVSGARAVDAGRLDRGDVAALAGFRSIRAGDVLTAEEGDPTARWEEPAPALLRVELLAGDMARRPELVAACRELEAEEPGLRPLELPETGALLLHVTGVMQVEVLVETLAERFGLEVEVGPPEVVYRERPARVAEAEDHYTMPKPCWAVTRFRVEPLPPGSGLRYQSVVPDTRISYRYQGQVEQTVPLVLEQGVYGWQVTDIAVTLVDGEDHHVHTHPLDFVTVTPMALRRALFAAGSVLLEPIWRYRLLLPEETASRVIGELLGRRGTIVEDELEGGGALARRRLTGRLPVATGLDFPVVLARLSGGRGLLELVHDGYEPCPPGESHVSPYRGIDPLDRERYILSVRGAL